MNVLVLEDDPSAMSVISYLNDRGYNVWHAQNLLDVAYYLEREPGLNNFDKLMFDVAVPLNTFSFMGNEPVEYGEKYGFSGFEFVAENYNLLNSKKIALITAYKTTLFENIYETVKHVAKGLNLNNLDLPDETKQLISLEKYVYKGK